MKKSDQQNIIKLYESSQQKEPVMTVDKYETKIWKLNGLYHRVDGPAIEYADGTKMWYQSDIIHRVGAPAIEWANGTKMWFQNGMCHCIDRPAIERADRTKEWWLNGEPYDDMYKWAKAALEYQKLSAETKDVKNYVKKVLEKLAEDEI